MQHKALGCGGSPAYGPISRDAKIWQAAKIFDINFFFIAFFIIIAIAAKIIFARDIHIIFAFAIFFTAGIILF
jgi:hypothetical protein